MRLYLLAATVVLVTVSPCLGHPEPNLLKNAGFEEVAEQDWADHWEIWPEQLPEAGAVSVDNQVAHSGQRSVRLTHHSPNSYTRAQQRIAVEPDTRYLFTFWIKASNLELGEGGNGARLYITVPGGGDKSIGAGSGTFDWQQVRLGPFNSGKATRFTVLCYLHRATGTVWFDDLAALKVTPAMEAEEKGDRARQRFQADLALATEAAQSATDSEALADLTGISLTGEQAEFPVAVDHRAGPPYFLLHAQVFQAMARLNARRLPETKKLAVWVSNPFEPLPVLGLVPARRPMEAEVLMGRNEREQVAVTLCNLTDKPLRVRVNLELFSGERAPRATLREVVHVVGYRRRMIADGLPRLKVGHSGAYLILPPGLFKQIWLDIHSDNVSPGNYPAALTVRPAGGSQIAVPIAARVLPVTFPEDVPIVTWGYSYQNWPLIANRWEQAAADLAAHHINAYCWPEKWYLPFPEFDDSGNLLPLDWSKFDAGLASHRNIKWLLLWPQFDKEDRLQLKQNLEVGSEEWERKFIIWFRALIAGLRERGFGYDRVAWYLVDEPCSSSKVNAVVTTGSTIKKADPQALIMENPYHACRWEFVEKMAPVVDVWCPHLRWAVAEGDRVEFFRENSKILWSYQVLGKRGAFALYRLSFWRCWSEGMTGQGFWDYADCGGSNWDPYDSERGDWAVIYDGDPDELIPSKRWEAWREGVEDYTYLWMLREALAQGQGTPTDRRVAQKLLEGLPTELFQRIPAGIPDVARGTPQVLERVRGEILEALARLNVR